MANKANESKMKENVSQHKSLSPFIESEVHVLRMDWLRTMMQSGCPISKSDDFRDFLQVHGKINLTHHSHLLRTYLKAVIKEENDNIRHAIKDKLIGVFFDETTIVWVNMCVIICFVDDKGILQHRCNR